MASAGKFFLTWEEAFHSGVNAAGGKGWNLGRLARYGFNIPKGGVFTTQAYIEFVKHNRLQDRIENVSGELTAENIDYPFIKDKLLILRKKIQESSMPPYIIENFLINNDNILEKSLAVRSSALAEDSVKASFAGIHQSFLNVCGLNNMLEAVKGCYASLWSTEAVVYRRKLNISDQDVLPAVVVMEMIKAEAAGVGFTCDPQTGRHDVLVVNANFGLGESIVAGAVDPDTYYLDAMPWSAVPKILSRKTGRKEGLTRIKEDGETEFVRETGLSKRQVLSDEEIKKLGLLLLRVFEALGDCEQHQDVEWVYDGSDFVLVQARPVTALPRKTFDALKNQPEFWSNGNYRDAVPMVQSPLNRRLSINMIDTIQKFSFTETGYRLPEGLQFSKFFNGRLYCNLSALQWAMFDNVGGLPQYVNIFWGGHQPEIELKDPNPLKGLTGLKRMWNGIKSLSLTNKAAKNASQTFTRVSRSIEVLTVKGFSHMQDRDFIHLYNELGKILKELSMEFSFLSAAGSMPVVSLSRILEKYFPDRALAVLNALMVGGEAGITSADHGYRLVDLAGIARRDQDAVQFLTGASFDPLAWEKQLPERSTFKQAFREFIREYGHRAVYELDIINPRWKEDPAYLLGIIRSTINTADLDKLKTEQKEKFERAWLEIQDKVPSSKHVSIKKLIRKSQTGAAVREQTKSVLAIVIEAYRMLAQELGSRFYERAIIQERSDIYFCTWPELFSVLTGAWDGVGLRTLVAERKDRRKEMESIAPPDVIFGEIPKYTEPVVQTSGNCLMGVPVAAGRASGRARLIYHPNEGNSLQPGDILIAPSTDPGWTPLFLKAGAVVMETGGFLSHGAIVAREYGIPAVVNIPGVLKLIKANQMITVDGDAGKVYLTV